MNYGPLVFLFAFFALATSWCGFVLAPRLQVGREQPGTNIVNTAQLYPQQRPGVARQGEQVYRANGCAACHTEQVNQTGTTLDVVLTDVGTNPVAVAEALVKANVGIANISGPALSAELPKAVAHAVGIDTARSVTSALSGAGAKAHVKIVSLARHRTRVGQARHGGR